MSRGILASVVLVGMHGLLALSAPTNADAGDPKKARAHARQAKAYFDAGDYAHAAEQYRAAFDIDHRPSRIYNLAVCSERGGDRRRALELYKRYLELDPDGEAADVAAEAIASLDQQLSEEFRSEAQAAEERQRAEAVEAERRAEAARAMRVWEAAERYRQAGDSVRAAERYRAYLAAAPASDLGLQARAWLELEVALAATSQTHSPGRGGHAFTDVDNRATAMKGKGPEWLVLGGMAAAAGLIADLAPSSSVDGKFNATDLVPLGCYALAVTFVAVWSF